MELEQIVASRELSERMAELKIFDDCLFWWTKSTSSCYKNQRWEIMEVKAGYINLPAPTVAEMINKLPANIKIGIKTYRPELWKDEDGYGIRYMYFSSKCLIHFRGINLKDEISKMLIYLKENKLI